MASDAPPIDTRAQLDLETIGRLQCFLASRAAIALAIILDHGVFDATGKAAAGIYCWCCEFNVIFCRLLIVEIFLHQVAIICDLDRDLVFSNPAVQLHVPSWMVTLAQPPVQFFELRLGEVRKARVSLVAR